MKPIEVTILQGIGIPIYEGYGLTETSPAVSVNFVDNAKIGTVGKPIPGVEVKISADGEILVKGKNVMKGYYNQPILTKEVIDTDNFFHTGDLGEIDADGYLKITGRKKELFKTSGGKYINPVVLEGVFQNSRFIQTVMIVGENYKFPSALIVPDFENVRTHLQKNSLLEKEDLIKDADVQ